MSRHLIKMLIGLAIIGILGFSFLFLFNEYDKEIKAEEKNNSSTCLNNKKC